MSDTYEELMAPDCPGEGFCSDCHKRSAVKMTEFEDAYGNAHGKPATVCCEDTGFLPIQCERCEKEEDAATTLDAYHTGHWHCSWDCAREDLADWLEQMRVAELQQIGA